MKHHLLSFFLFLTFGLAFYFVVSQVSTPDQEAETIIPLDNSSETAVEDPITEVETADFFNLLFARDVAEADVALANIKAGWQPTYIPMSLEVINFLPLDYSADGLLEILKTKTGQDFGFDVNDWFFWWWSQEKSVAPGYDNFKSALYSQIDPRFAIYFRDRFESAQINLDEIRWGGVLQDGIPPLRDPEMISANQATYLEEDHVVFGIEINDDARAYPKRILAWHEMFVDTVGGVPVAGVYCTLCGAVILYETTVDGTNHELGTSGFLYRSNKLMYDKATQSLWNTIRGEPVLGPLVGKDIALKHRSIVTTTWGEWKARHPETQVLSLETGHNRNYGEGVAYNQYFASDQLMFNTPFNDQRLNNKQEILALRFPAHPTEQLAIDTDLLSKNPIYTDRIGAQSFVVLTDKTGANRVYENKEIVFTKYDQDNTVTDQEGNTWTLTESELKNGSQTLQSLPYHRAFWFGWHATFPESRLVK